MKGSILITFATILSTSFGAGKPTECVGTVGFSSYGAQDYKRDSGLIKYKTDNFDNSYGGWVRDLGTFTVKCPGFYQIAFAGYGDSDTKLTLWERLSTGNNQWKKIVTTPSGGGSASAMIYLSTGEQVLVKVTGTLRTDSSEPPLTYFYAYRIN